MPKSGGFLFALVLVGLGPGCGGKYFRPYVHDPAARTAVTRRNSGISLQVDPLLDRHACQTNFGMDCLEKGILPVYLTAANESTNASFRIISSRIWFSPGENDAVGVASGIQQTNNSAAGSGVAVAGGALGSILIAGWGMKLTDDAESIRENFVIKQFQNINLAPGRSAEGFIYFVQDHPISPASLPWVHVPVLDVQGQLTNTISLPLVSPQ